MLENGKVIGAVNAMRILAGEAIRPSGPHAPSRAVANKAFGKEVARWINKPAMNPALITFWGDRSSA